MSTTPPTPQHFTIVNQEHSYRYMPNGDQRGEWTITFETPSGVQSQIIIPDAAYNARTVGQAIAHQVHEIEAVHKLTEAHPPPMPPA